MSKALLICVALLSFSCSAQQRELQCSDRQRVAALGNSITLHPKSAALDWYGNWGMAASAADHDYLHYYASLLASKDPKCPTDVKAFNISGIERNPKAFAFDQWQELSTFNPTIIVLFLGDNVSADDQYVSEFSQRYSGLVGQLQQLGAGQLLCVSTWWRRSLIDSTIRSACARHNGNFVVIGKFNQDSTRASQFNHTGVASHPNDSGMRLIGAALYSATRKGIQ